MQVFPIAITFPTTHSVQDVQLVYGCNSSKPIWQQPDKYKHIFASFRLVGCKLPLSLLTGTGYLLCTEDKNGLIITANVIGWECFILYAQAHLELRPLAFHLYTMLKDAGFYNMCQGHQLHEEMIDEER